MSNLKPSRESPHNGYAAAFARSTLARARVVGRFPKPQPLWVRFPNGDGRRSQLSDLCRAVDSLSWWAGGTRRRRRDSGLGRIPTIQRQYRECTIILVYFGRRKFRYHPYSFISDGMHFHSDLHPAPSPVSVAREAPSCLCSKPCSIPMFHKSVPGQIPRNELKVSGLWRVATPRG